MLVAGLIAIAVAGLVPAAARAALVPAVGSPLAVGAKPWEANAADVNGDGHQDLLVTNYDDGTVSVLLGSGTGRFTPEAGSPVAVGDTPIATAVGHLDGDTRLDVAVTTSADRLTILLPQGRQHRLRRAARRSRRARPAALRRGRRGRRRRRPRRPRRVEPRRIDGVVPRAAARRELRRRDRLAVCGRRTTAGLATGDVDGDGDPDIAVVSNGQDFVTVLSNGPAGFAAEGSPIAVGDAPTRIAASDLAGDARPDPAIANSGDDSVRSSCATRRTTASRRPRGRRRRRATSPTTSPRPTSTSTARASSSSRTRSTGRSRSSPDARRGLRPVARLPAAHRPRAARARRARLRRQRAPRRGGRQLQRRLGVRAAQRSRDAAAARAAAGLHAADRRPGRAVAREGTRATASAGTTRRSSTAATGRARRHGVRAARRQRSPVRSPTRRTSTSRAT